VIRRRKLLDAIRQLRGHGMTSGTFQRYSSRTVGYDVTMLGFNDRMMNESSAGPRAAETTVDWNERRKF